MSGMFSGCSSLTTLDLSHFDTSNVSLMAGMFECCLSLVTLDLSHFDTSKVEYFYHAFDYCRSLKTVILRKCNLQTVRMIKNALVEAGIDSEIITD